MTRTKFDPNELIDKGEYFVINTYDEDNNVCGTGKFDKCDLELIEKHKWGMDGQGYLATLDDKRKRLSMHRFLLNPKDHELIDHINMDKSDNRRFNLRIVGKSYNEVNKSIRRNNTSGVKGISYRRDRGTWASEIKLKDVRLRKSFKSFDEAVKFRILNEMKIFGEYSHYYNHTTNTIELEYVSKDDGLNKTILVDKSLNVTVS